MALLWCMSAVEVLWHFKRLNRMACILLQNSISTGLIASDRPNVKYRIHNPENSVYNKYT